MSTHIKTIKGCYHEYVSVNYEATHTDAKISLTRFYNGDASYIHLTQKQCKKLAEALLECFDYNKYPSE